MSIIIYIIYELIFIALIVNQFNKVDKLKSDKSLWETIKNNFILMLGVALLGYFLTLFINIIGILDRLIYALIFDGVLIFLTIINIIIFIVAVNIKNKKK